MTDLPSALEKAMRTHELNRAALLDLALLLRDLRTAIRVAIEALDRKSPETARRTLKQALDEMPVEMPQKRRRER